MALIILMFALPIENVHSKFSSTCEIERNMMSMLKYTMDLIIQVDYGCELL